MIAIQTSTSCVEAGKTDTKSSSDRFFAIRRWSVNALGMKGILPLYTTTRDHTVIRMNELERKVSNVREGNTHHSAAKNILESSITLTEATEQRSMRWSLINVVQCRKRYFWIAYSISVCFPSLRSSSRVATARYFSMSLECLWELKLIIVPERTI